MSPFKRGDVVVCVDSSPATWMEPQQILKLHGVYRISDVGNGWPAPWCEVEGVPVDPMRGWGTLRFRHLPKADPAFTEAMRALRPEKEGVA